MANIHLTDVEDTITLISKDYVEEIGCDVRRLKLVIDGVTKTMVHYHFAKWPDFGKPENEDRKALIELCRQSYVEAGLSPRVVHCSAGVGRTGTWIALDFLIREVEAGHLLYQPAHSNSGANSKPISEPQSETWAKSEPSKVQTPTSENPPEQEDHDLIFEVVNTLREQRMMMVIKDVQLQFLYEAVQEAFIEKYDTGPNGPVITKSVPTNPQPSTRGPKARRVSTGTGTEQEDDSPSDAETDIMAAENQTVLDDQDPYAIPFQSTLS